MNTIRKVENMDDDKNRQLWIKILFIVFIAVLLLISLPGKLVDASGWGYSRNDEHKAPEIGKYAQIIKNNDAYYIGNGKNIYLTFDAGYDNGVLPDILKVLREKEVAATFFVTGDFVNRYTPLLKQMIKDGHLLGNHSYGHLANDMISTQKMMEEIHRLEEVYFEKTNSVLAKIYRPPEGRFTKETLETLKSNGYKTFFWSIAFVDWKDNNVNSYKAVIDNLHDGAIILLHTVSRSNADALGNIIDEIRRQGYEFKLLTEI